MQGNPPCLEQVTKDMVNAYFERLSLGEPDLKSYPTTSFVNSPMPLLYKHVSQWRSRNQTIRCLVTCIRV